jgi:hypothetical protein
MIEDKEKLKIWAAGLFDGEGSALIEKTGECNFQVVVCVVNTNKRAVDIFRELWEGTGKRIGGFSKGWKSTRCTKGEGTNGHKDWYKVVFNYQDAEVMFTDILPYLVVKKEEAMLVLCAVRAIRDNPNEAYWKILEPFYAKSRGQESMLDKLTKSAEQDTTTWKLNRLRCILKQSQVLLS